MPKNIWYLTTFVLMRMVACRAIVLYWCTDSALRCFPVMLLGGVCMLACIAVAVNGESLGHFELSLILLGIGWNFLYIGATARLLECCPVGQKVRVQAFNDSLVFLAIAGVTFNSGKLLDEFGWAALNLYSVLPLAMVMLAIGWQWLVSRRAAPV